jgi:soluble lytic murein transglycosylase-like protein
VRQLPPGDCEPIADDEIASITARAAVQHGVPASLIRAVIARESGGKPCAVSPKGARGLMQLMPGTQSDLGVSDPFDPVQNVTAGAAYLKQMLDRYRQDLRLALAAFNAGPARVDEIGGVPRIAETQEYVEAILSQMSPSEQ